MIQPHKYVFIRLIQILQIICYGIYKCHVQLKQTLGCSITETVLSLLLHSATGIFRFGLVLTMTRMINSAKGKTISATNRNCNRMSYNC